jgi:putative ABC transport system permease protein
MCWGETLEVEGRPAPEGQIPPVTGARIATTDYFRIMGIRVRGRTFTPDDARTVGVAAILSEAAAQAYFPSEDPIGRRLRFGSSGVWHTIVGVADDVAGALGDHRFARTFYLPVFPEAADGPPPANLVYVIRTAVAPESVAPAARAIVADHDRLLPLADVRTLQQHIDRATAPTAFALALVGLAAGIALVLGVVGVYAVVAYAVSRRTAEIGVRMAIGASPAQVARLVMRQGGRVILAGVAIGCVASLTLSGFAEGLLFGVSPTDPLSYVSVIGILIAVAGAALWLPARRAARIDPAAALRAE